MRTLIAVLLSSACVGAATAADAVHVVEAPLAKPKKAGDKRVKEPLDKVALHVWVPDGVPVVRGAVFNPFNEKQVEQKHWREAARLWGFAVVGADYFGVNAADYGPTLAGGLKTLAAELKRPEFENVPFVMVGMSAGAGMCVKFADQLPDRTVAVAPVCLEVGPSSEAARRVPMLTVFGEKDGRQFDILTEKLPAERKSGARWAVAVQWGRGHEFGAANNLAMPLFDAAIRLRYPADADPAKGPVKLRDIPEEAGWLARHPPRGGTAEPPREFKDWPAGREAGWLPTPGLARAWHGFVSRSPVTIKEPAPLGDGRPFALLEPGTPVKLVLAGAKGMTRFEVYDGDARLASFSRAEKGDAAEFTLPKLEPGIHPLVVYPGDETDVAFAPTRPAAVVVRR